MIGSYHIYIYTVYFILYLYKIYVYMYIIYIYVYINHILGVRLGLKEVTRALLSFYGSGRPRKGHPNHGLGFRVRAALHLCVFNEPRTTSGCSDRNTTPYESMVSYRATHTTWLAGEPQRVTYELLSIAVIRVWLSAILHCRAPAVNLIDRTKELQL